MPGRRLLSRKALKARGKWRSTTNRITKHSTESACRRPGRITADRIEEPERIQMASDKAQSGIASPEQSHVAAIPSSKERLAALLDPPIDPEFDINSIFTAVDASLARKRIAPAPAPLRPNPQHQSPFFRIPLEIRSKIYQSVLVAPEQIIDPHELMEIWREDSQKTPPACGISGSLLRTCSRIYQEAVLIPYQENTFVFTSAYSITCFRGLDYIMPGCPLRTQMLRKVHLWFGNSPASSNRIWPDLPDAVAKSWREHFFGDANSMMGELESLILDFSEWPEVASGFVGYVGKGVLKAKTVRILGLERREDIKGKIEEIVMPIG